VSPGLEDTLDADAAETLRYREILSDWASFAREVHAPPPCVLPHPQRIDRASLAQLLATEGVRSDPVAWHPSALRLSRESRPGLCWPFRAGLYQIQEEASLLPVALLAPQAGERVLDLCAAPGGKSAQLAVAAGPRGAVVANDRSGRRLSALREKSRRWGLFNLVATVQDGCGFPVESGPFDRVLVDAPCSAERGPVDPRSRQARGAAGFRARIGQTQRALLRRALSLCRPGGRVVYSTCSLAPEENEAVVDAVLRERRHDFRLVPASLDGLARSPGLVEWHGQHFDPSLSTAVRLWPHRAGTGGFFAALLEPLGTKAADPPPPDGADLEPADAELLGRVEDVLRRFGLPDGVRAGMRFVRKGARELHAVSSSVVPPRGVEVAFLGVPFFKLSGGRPKPNTAIALWMGTRATRNVLDIDAAQAARYLVRDPFAARPSQLHRCGESGFVVVRRNGRPLGMGLLRPQAEGTHVESCLPRAWVPGPRARRPPRAPASAQGGEAERSSSS